MKQGGLFTRHVSTKKKARSRKVPIDTLRKSGPQALGNWNPDAMHPNMDPILDSDDVYVVGWAPTEDADELGEPFQDEEGDLIRAELRRVGVRHASYDYCIRTLPPTGRKKSVPEDTAAYAWEDELAQDIEKKKPSVVLAVGAKVCNRLTGTSHKGEVLRGRRFPKMFGKHTCWVLCIDSPARILKSMRYSEEKGFRRDDLQHMLQIDLRRIAKLRKVEPVVHTKEFALSHLNNCTCYWRSAQLDAALDALAAWHAREMAGDLETTFRRVFNKGEKVLSIAFGTNEEIHSIALDHPDAEWDTAEREELLDAIEDMITSGASMCWHNESFDLEWLAGVYGEHICTKARKHKWDCTQAMTYTLDCRVGQSLDMVCIENFGLQLKKLSGIDRTNLENYGIERVLKYNALDVAYGWYAKLALKKRLEEEGLWEVYSAHRRRVPAFVRAQVRGLPVDQKRVNEIKEDLQAHIADAEEALAATEEVQQYEEEYGAYSPSADEHAATILEHIIGTKKGRKSDGTYSVDKVVLDKVGGAFAEALLEWRKWHKLWSTYARTLQHGVEGSVVHDDGRLHTRLNHTRTATSRLSSSDPNLQNWPKRNEDGKQLRRAIRAPKGHVLLSVDYGQIEARVIALLSKDKAFKQSLIDGYDVHREWAVELIDVYPTTCINRYGVPDVDDPKDKPTKKFRGDVKNQWVFPAFFGAGCKSISGNLDCPQEILQPVFNRFWKQFAGVKRWQGRLIDDYVKNGYVECKTGRRRAGPLNKNMIINTPVQGTAAEIVNEGIAQLELRALKERAPWLSPVLQIHDDLTFVVPKQHLMGALHMVVHEMVNVKYDWIDVPIAAEAEVGLDWANMTPVLKCDDRDIDSKLKKVVLPDIVL